MSNLLEHAIPDAVRRKRQQGRARLRVQVTERLLIEMEDANLSKSDVARMVGVTRSAVTQALNGDRNMTLNALHDYADVLGFEAVVEFVKQAPAEMDLALPGSASVQFNALVTQGAVAEMGVPATQLGNGLNVQVIGNFSPSTSTSTSTARRA